MNRLVQVIFYSLLLLALMFTGCESINSLIDPMGSPKTHVYDPSVPAENTCSLSQSYTVTVKQFNGKSVNWIRYNQIIIPAGEHEFLVDYSWERPLGGGKVERHTSRDITARFRFLPGNEYTIGSREDSSGRTVGIVFSNNTEIMAEREREKRRVEEEFKTSLPAESTTPTILEGKWVWTRQGWAPQYFNISGNAWEYVTNTIPEKGLFSISGDVLTLFTLFRKFDDGWRPETDYRNAVSEHRFTIEADGSLRMKTIKGFSKEGPFIKE